MTREAIDLCVCLPPGYHSPCMKVHDVDLVLAHWLWKRKPVDIQLLHKNGKKRVSKLYLPTKAA